MVRHLRVYMTYKDVFVKDGEGYGVSQQQVNQDYTITSVIDDRPPSVLYYELLFGLSPEEIARQPFSTSWYHNVKAAARATSPGLP